jgi:hypothetical protein
MSEEDKTIVESTQAEKIIKKNRFKEMFHALAKKLKRHDIIYHVYLFEDSHGKEKKDGQV